MLHKSINAMPDMSGPMPATPDRGPSCFDVLTNTLDMANDLAAQVMGTVEKLIGPTPSSERLNETPSKQTGLFGAIDDSCRDTSRRLAAAMDAINSLHRVLP